MLTSSNSVRTIHKEQNHTLIVTIIGATKLRNADFKPAFGLSDPYCVCEIKDKPGSRKQTHHIWNDLNPIWDYVTEIEDFCIDDTLIFQVWDKDLGKPDDFLGSVELKGESFLGHGYKGPLPLEERGKKTEATLHIEILSPLQMGVAHSYDDIDESFLQRDIFDQEWELHGAQMLTRSSLNVQYWALGFCIISLPLVIWASSNSLSCVNLAEHETRFLHSCPHIAASAQALSVPDFCWKPCMRDRTFAMQFYLVIAMAMQAIVVISNHSGCNRWMQVTVTSDFYQQMDEIDGLLEQEMDENAVTGQSSGNMGPVHRFVFQKMMRKTMVYARTFKATIIAKVRQTSSTNKGLTVLQARLALRLGIICVFLSACTVVILTATSYSMYSSFLRCSGRDLLTLVPKTSWLHLGGLVIAAGLLMLALYLQLCAKWTKRFKLLGVEHNRSSIKKLKEQFTKKYCVRHARSLSPEYKVLQGVPFQQLLWVEHDGYMDLPDRAFGCKEWRGDVVLHFKIGRSLRDVVCIANKHRLAAAIVLFVGALGLHAAARQCWTCVSGIHAKNHVTGTEMEELLLLFGSCGRHRGVGSSCQIAAVVMFIAWLQQMLIIWLSDANFVGGHSVQSAVAAHEEYRKHHQLWLRLFNYHTDPSLSYDMAKFQEVGAAMPEFYCHTWVQVDDSASPGGASAASSSPRSASQHSRKGSKDGNAPKEIVTSCDAALGEDSASSSRDNWCRSKLPRLVALQEAPPVETVSTYIRGLVRDEYSVPSICIRIHDDSGADKIQMVPPQFVGGHGVGVWVNLGPKAAWEKLSGGCSFLAFGLTLCDLAYYFLTPRGSILAQCNDVLNDRCEDFHIKSKWHHSADQIDFRRSSGCALACFGAACALAACLCMRVASVMDGRYNPTCQIVSEYGKAILSTFTVWCGFIGFIFESIWQCFSERVNSQCFAQAQADDNDVEVSLLGEESLSRRQAEKSGS